MEWASWLPPVAYGAFILPIAMWFIAGHWMVEWTGFGVTSWGNGFAADGAVALGFWFVAGTAWGWPRGLVGPALGLGLLTPFALRACSGEPGAGGDGDMIGGAIAFAFIFAVIGLVAYPLGLLARGAVRRWPRSGVIASCAILALGLWATVTSRQPTYDPVWWDEAAPTSMILAPALCLVGFGTLVASLWSMASRGSAERTAQTAP